MVTKQELIDFEQEIGDLFNSKQIKAPIHLYNGNEDQMMFIFKNFVKPDDWVCCTWRNHYQALLKGIPKDVVKEEIMKGKSMVMTLPEYKFICSSIVGGIAPVAAGIALGEKLRQTNNQVWCWVGDMSAETGAFHEAYKYACNKDLPITFVVELNGMSVLTPTDEVWGRDVPYYITDHKMFNKSVNTCYVQHKLIAYRYTNTKYPHAGAGMRVQF